MRNVRGKTLGICLVNDPPYRPHSVAPVCDDIHSSESAKMAKHRTDLLACDAYDVAPADKKALRLVA